MDTLERIQKPSAVAEIEQQLRPAEMRRRSIGELDALFRSGSTPDPRPEGFLPGKLITMSVSRPSDALVRGIAKAYMPWMGKSFDSQQETGVNILIPSAKTPMKGLWPKYEPEREVGDRIEAFPFNTRVAPGELDPEVDVLKIDYDFDANPGFIIRHILDELVQIDDGFYLGKILYRLKGSFRPIGFFTLQRA
jgi:hypothetical protein